MNSHPVDKPPRVLIVDDNAAIHEDFRKILGGQIAAGTRLNDVEKALFGEPTTSSKRATFRIDSAYQGQEALALVQKALAENDPYVLAFVDVRMPPGWDGVETLERIWQCCPELQAVICTAYADYSWDDFTRQLGARDNLVILKKPFETVEVLQLAHALARKWALARQANLRMGDLDRMVCERTKELQHEVEERLRVQEALGIAEQRFLKVFQASPLPMAIQNFPEGRFLDANSSFLALTGHIPERFLRHTAAELRLWGNGAAEKTGDVPPNSRISNHSCVLRRSDGVARDAILWMEPITLDAGLCRLIIVQDVTDQLKLEAELRQGQKMDVVCRLTASVAHEFNNILTVIQGHAGLLRVKPDDARFTAEAAERIARASQRAASLTSRLLAFSRKLPLQLKPVNLSAVVHGLQKTFRQLIGERHSLQFDCAENLPPTRADEGSLEQILTNLVLNARDAMPDSGTIRVSTSLAEIDGDCARKNPAARAGRFACLSVTDTGCGMSQEILSHLFDPFFTTKEVGKGTGLGLATIRGIAQQHQGWVEVTSQTGRGSTFKVFLPICDEVPEPVAVVTREPVPRGGFREAVPVAEGNASVCEPACLAPA